MFPRHATTTNTIGPIRPQIRPRPQRPDPFADSDFPLGRRRASNASGVPPISAGGADPLVRLRLPTGPFGSTACSTWKTVTDSRLRSDRSQTYAATGRYRDSPAYRILNPELMPQCRRIRLRRVRRSVVRGRPPRTSIDSPDSSVPERRTSWRSPAGSARRTTSSPPTARRPIPTPGGRRARLPRPATTRARGRSPRAAGRLPSRSHGEPATAVDGDGIGDALVRASAVTSVRALRGSRGAVELRRDGLDEVPDSGRETQEKDRDHNKWEHAESHRRGHAECAETRGRSQP